MNLNREAFMVSLYIIAIVLGVIEIVIDHIWLGWVQVILCGVLLPLRLVRLIRSVR